MTNDLATEVIRVSTEGFDDARNELRQTEKAFNAFAGGTRSSTDAVTRAVIETMARETEAGKLRVRTAKAVAAAHSEAAAAIVAGQTKAAAAEKTAAKPGPASAAPLARRAVPESYLERGETALRRGVGQLAVNAKKQLDSLTAAAQSRAAGALGSAKAAAGSLGRRALDAVPEPVRAGALKVRERVEVELGYAGRRAAAGLQVLNGAARTARDSFGKVIERLKEQEWLQKRAAGAALAAGAVTGGLLARGLSGTVEGNQLGREVDLVARELVGVFKPAIASATEGLRGFRKWMEGLSPEGQDKMLAGGAVAGGALALNKGGVGGLKAVPIAAALFGLADKARNLWNVGEANTGMDRRMEGDLTADEFAGAKERYGDILKIEDPQKRAAAARAAQDKELDKSRKLTGSMMDPRTMLRATANEFDNYFGTDLGLIGEDVKPGQLRVNHKNMTEAAVQNQENIGFLGKVKQAAQQNRLPDAPAGALPNPEHRAPMLAQAGYGAAGSTYEDLQIELLKQGAAPKDEKKDVLDQVLAALGDKKEKEDALGTALTKLLEFLGRQPMHRDGR